MNIPEPNDAHASRGRPRDPAPTYGNGITTIFKPGMSSCRDLRCQRSSRPVVERAVQVAEDFQRRLVWGFGYEPRDLPAIAHENDFLLLTFYTIEHGAEVARDLGDGERVRL